MNTEKLLESLCTNNETSEREIKVSILFTIAKKKKKKNKMPRNKPM